MKPKSEFETCSLVEAMKVPLQVGKFFGFLPFQQTDTNGKHRTRAPYLLATVVTLAWLAGFTYWYISISLDGIGWIAKQNTSLVILSCQIISSDGLHVGIWAELLIIMATCCRKQLAILNEFAEFEAARPVISDIRKKIRNHVWILIASMTLVQTAAVWTLLDSNQPEYLSFVPVAVVYVAVDTVFVGFTNIPYGFLKVLNSELRSILETGNLKKALPPLQAKHGTACEWIERVTGFFESVFLVRVLSTFLVSIACLVLTWSLIPHFNLTKSEVRSLLLGSILQIATVFFRLYFICYLATLSLDEVKRTRTLLSTVDTSDYTMEERILLQGFQQQLELSRPELSVHGYFDIGKGLLLSILGHVGTYAVVCIQFN